MGKILTDDIDSVLCFKKVLRELGNIKLLDQISNNGEFKETSVPIDMGVVFGHWMGIIIMSGKDLKLVFRIHFMAKDTQKVISDKLGTSIDTTNVESAKDFIKETCNLIVGHLKNEFEKNSFQVGVSLPYCTTGLDEIFMDRPKSDLLFDRWCVSNGNINFTFNYHLEVSDIDKFSKMDFSKFNIKDENEGEIDFL